MNLQGQKARLILLPGLGADARMFAPQMEAFPDLEVPDWLEPKPREPLSEFAERMAENMAESIDIDEPFYLGGASFGGMVALEVARHLKPRGVLLLGSCRSPLAIPWRLRMMARLGSHMPDAIIGLKRLIPPRPWSVLAELDEPDRRLYCQMITDISPRFLKWAAGAIATWKGVVDDIDAPIYHVHGQNDWVIRTTHVHPDRTVPDAGHLVSNSHPQQVNAFIQEMIGKARHGKQQPKQD